MIVNMMVTFEQRGPVCHDCYHLVSEHGCLGVEQVPCKAMVRAGRKK
jgi:hypothetical protein